MKAVAGRYDKTAAAGNYVPFVLRFNFVAGFAYVIAGIGMLKQRQWAEPALAGMDDHRCCGLP